MTPLLKWPGGKRAILPHILKLIPANYNRYFEPFFGGGALFFALQPRNAVLTDINNELIECYIQVRDNPDGVIRYLGKLRNTSDDYYKVRSSAPVRKAAKAARLIYLTTLSFNGLYRLNQKGEFNVPYGGKTHIVPCDAEKIKRASTALSNVTLKYCDFERILLLARCGDLVYIDPPYTVAHGTNGFIKYNARIFGWADQIRLSNVLQTLNQRGCHIIVSNADHNSIRTLYPTFNYTTVSRHSRIASSKDYRGMVTECIIHNIGECLATMILTR